VNRLRVALLLLLPAAPALAQQNDVALLAGYRTAGGIDMTAAGIQDLEIAGSATWGLAARRFFSRRLGAEVSWTRQDSALRLSTRDGEADLFDMDVSVLQASGIYRFGWDRSAFRPFVLAGLGATFLDATELEGETKFSLSLGGGVDWATSERTALRAQARYLHAFLDDSSSDFCDPFDFCQGSLHQFELVGGVVFRF
jgi:opacity protein-like surface antigen